MSSCVLQSTGSCSSRSVWPVGAVSNTVTCQSSAAAYSMNLSNAAISSVQGEFSSSAMTRMRLRGGPAGARRPGCGLCTPRPPPSGRSWSPTGRARPAPACGWSVTGTSSTSPTWAAGSVVSSKRLVALARQPDGGDAGDDRLAHPALAGEEEGAGAVAGRDARQCGCSAARPLTAAGVVVVAGTCRPAAGAMPSKSSAGHRAQPCHALDLPGQQIHLLLQAARSRARSAPGSLAASRGARRTARSRLLRRNHRR